MIGEGYSWDESDRIDMLEDELAPPRTRSLQWRGWRRPPQSATEELTPATSNSIFVVEREEAAVAARAAITGKVYEQAESIAEAITEQTPPVDTFSSDEAYAKFLHNRSVMVMELAKRIAANKKILLPVASGPITPGAILKAMTDVKPPYSLTELSLRVVAKHIPFEAVEQFSPPVPEQLQLRIAFRSFPNDTEDIRLYACLANGTADEFLRGEVLAKSHSAVQMCLQIGFYLTASVVTSPDTLVRVSVTFDRQKIVSCECECDKPSPWCHHVVAVCLHRILKPEQIRLRAPISESLHRLSREQLMKLTQYLIADLPHPMLIRAQELIDDLTLDEFTEINRIQGAPDPTAGSSTTTTPLWNVNIAKVRESIHEIIENNLSIPRPMVLSDINHLSSAPPPTSAEWSALLRPLRAKDPESLWNLLAMIREMIGRKDRNAVKIMHVLTDEILRNSQLLLWWFTINVSNIRGYPSLTASTCTLTPETSSPGSSRQPAGINIAINFCGNSNSSNSNNIAMYNTNALCDEVINLWRIIASDPAVDPCEGLTLFQQLADYHLRVLKTVSDLRACTLDPYIASASGSITYMTPTDDLRAHQRRGLNQPTSMIYPMKSRSDAQTFSGFKPAMLACTLDWEMEYHRPNSVGVRSMANCPPPAAAAAKTEASLERRTWRLRATEIVLEYAPQLAQVELSPIEELAAIDPFDSAYRFVNSYLRELQIRPESIRLYQHRRNNQRVADLEAANKLGAKVLAILKPSLPPRNGDEDKNQSEDRHDEGDEEDKDKGTIKLIVKTRPLTTNPHIYMAAKLTQHMNDEEKMLLRAETLYAHGHLDEAIELAVQLAQKLLSDPPVFHADDWSNSNASTDCNYYGGRKHGTYNSQRRGVRPRLNPELHKVSVEASAALSKASFLIHVLGERTSTQFLAFQVGLFGLEMARPPASTKTLEVKLDYQEAELVTALKHIPLTEMMLDVLREKAQQLATGQMTVRGECLLPVYLANYIFDAMVISFKVRSGELENRMRWGHPQHCTVNEKVRQQSTDEQLALEAATQVLALNIKLAEADHPLLCEGQRRQRGELALMLMVTLKDNNDQMEMILNALLDRNVHSIFKQAGFKFFTIEPYSKQAQINRAMLSSPPQESADDEGYNVCTPQQQYAQGSEVCYQDGANGTQAQPGDNITGSPPRVDANGSGGGGGGGANNSGEVFCKTRSSSSSSSGSCYESTSDTSNNDNGTPKEQSMQHPLQQSSRGTMPTPPHVALNYHPSANGYYGEYPVSNQSFNRTRQATTMTPSNSLRNGSSFAYPNAQNNNGNGWPSAQGRNALAPSYGHVPKHIRLRSFHKRNHFPTQPNHPSEAASHYMSELAKAVLSKAGGSSTSGHFVTDPNNGSNVHERPHRNLHLASLYIALYALGLHNHVTPNWTLRTYSTLVLFIEVRALEIGHEAFNVLTNAWEEHFTPAEVANLADQASNQECPKMQKAAAELAFSCLPYASGLQQSTLQCALRQCKKLNPEMFEEALCVVENASSCGMDSEVIFLIARYWFEIYECERDRRLGKVEVAKSANELAMEENVTWAEADKRRQQLQQSNSLQGRNQQAPQQPPQEPEPEPVAGPAQQQPMAAQAQLPPLFHNRRVQQRIPFLETDPYVRYTTEDYLSFLAADKGNEWNRLLRDHGVVVTQETYQRRNGMFWHGGMPSATTTNPERLKQIRISQRWQQLKHEEQVRKQLQLQQQRQQQQQQLQQQHIQQHQLQQQQQQQQQQLQWAQLRQQQWPQLPQQHEWQQGHSFDDQQQQQQQQQPECSSSSLVAEYPNPTADVDSMITERELSLLRNAFRLGMLAMHATALNHNSSSTQRYQRTVGYKDDIKWLLGVAHMLSVQNMHEFLEITHATVNSPEVLFEVASAACLFFHGTTMGNGGNDVLSVLIRKCQNLYYENLCTEISISNAIDGKPPHGAMEEIIALVFATQDAYMLSPNGAQIFQMSLDSLRIGMRSEYWVTINNALYHRPTPSSNTIITTTNTNNGIPSSPNEAGADCGRR